MAAMMDWCCKQARLPYKKMVKNAIYFAKLNQFSCDNKYIMQ